jgi:hypothetical protein
MPLCATVTKQNMQVRVYLKCLTQQGTASISPTLLLPLSEEEEEEGGQTVRELPGVLHVYSRLCGISS